MSELPEELPSDAFVASLPWWVVLGREGAESAAPGYLVLDVDGGTCLAVFTDEDLAERFVGAVDFDGGPLAVQTPEQFWQLARRLPRICTYAVFDPPPRVGGRARWVVPLGEVLRALAEAQGQHDDTADGAGEDFQSEDGANDEN